MKAKIIKVFIFIIIIYIFFSIKSEISKRLSELIELYSDKRDEADIYLREKYNEDMVVKSSYPKSAIMDSVTLEQTIFILLI